MATDPRYPIGRFQRPDRVSPDQRKALLDRIAALPAAARKAVAGLDDQQLDTPYRDGGWTVRQVVHHLGDSQLNAYARIKLLLTEDRPTVKVWHEQLWAELPDARTAPVEVSLRLLEGVHERWVGALRGQPEAAFRRVLVHPESGELSLDDMLALYAWHGDHHVAHVTGLRRARGW